MGLRDIEHIVFVMLENRSFDHMLGYLSLDETLSGLPVDGLRSDQSWRDSYTNMVNGSPHAIKRIRGDQPIRQDPPHGHASIAEQINTAPLGPGPSKMGGFAQTYKSAHGNLDDPSLVMGYYDRDDVPTYDFLARNFCVCDRWFTSLPLGTQANRLMAMAGESLVVDNVTGLPLQELVYDWLDDKEVSWRVYVSGGYAPFFIMMRQWSFRILKSLALGDGPFRRFSAFRKNWQSAGPMPSVVFIEPEYADAPMSDPNDDHPPAPIAKGQEFVRDIYDILTSNPERWQKTLMIVTYDEHGGFFDHVAPPAIETKIGNVTLATTGPRVPALLVSPHVGAGQVFSEPLDHTSFLQLLAERFTPGNSYSPAVDQRQATLGRLRNALLDEPRVGKAPAMSPRPPSAAPESLIDRVPRAPDTPNATAIDAVVRDLAKEHPELISQPGWSEMKAYLETNAPPIPEHGDNIGPEREG
jgi:phospholipase C